MIDEHHLSKLLDEPESETLDFKATFHENSVELVHDLLCLANSYADIDRYLVFGVQDKPRKITGIKDDPNIRTQSDIYDLLRQSYFNRIPTIHLQEFHVKEHTIAVLTIKNRPDKPFFLTQDKIHRVQNKGEKSKNLIIRAGVAYTRLGDTNTPLNESAPDDKIELMWRERFGLGLLPLVRFSKLLDKPDEWVREDSFDKENFYHVQYPEFRIQETDHVMENFSEPWVKRGHFPDPACRRYIYNLMCHGTVLKQVYMISCDGGRYTLPMPEAKLVNADDESGGVEYFVLTSSLRYKVSRLFRQYYPLEETLVRCGVELVNQ